MFPLENLAPKGLTHFYQTVLITRLNLFSDHEWRLVQHKFIQFWLLKAQLT